MNKTQIEKEISKLKVRQQAHYKTHKPINGVEQLCFACKDGIKIYKEIKQLNTQLKILIEEEEKEKVVSK